MQVKKCLEIHLVFAPLALLALTSSCYCHARAMNSPPPVLNSWQRPPTVPSHAYRSNSTSTSEPLTSYQVEAAEELSGCKQIGQNEDLRTREDWTAFRRHLEDYADFHRKQLKKLKSGDGRVRTLTWSCYNPLSCCGIGDQLYNIQQTLIYAMVSKRILSLHWNPTSYKTTKYLRPHRVDWTYFNRSIGMRAYHSKKQYKPGVRTVEFYGPFYKQLLSHDHIHMTVNHELQVPFIRGMRMAAASPGMNDTLAMFGITSLLTDDSTSVPLEIFGGEILRYLFLFEKSVLDKVDKVQRQLGLHVNPYLAVHIRTGFLGMEQDEGSHFNSRKAFRKSMDWEKTILCSLKLADKLNCPVYLATDSILVKKLAKSNYGERLKMANLTLQHVALTDLNKSAHNKKEDLTKRSTDPLEVLLDEREWDNVGEVDGYMATWIDFLLMSRASTLVHSISGFSVTAGQLCSTRSQYFVPYCTPRSKRRHH